MRTKLFLWSFVLLSSFSRISAAESQTLAPCHDCNVILISMDTVRADRIGAINPKSKLSPNIDRLAKAGYTYLNAFAQTPWTLPSHRSVFYGMHPWRLPSGQSMSDGVNQPLKPLPELFHEAGFKTAAFTSGVFITPEFGFDQGFDEFKQGKSWKDADFIADGATQWIEANQGRKFFLFLHSYHVHDPFEPQLATLKKVDPNYKGKLNSITVRKLTELELGKVRFTKADLRRITALYDAEVLELDRAIGRIIEEIRKLHLEKKTVIVLFSDHGEELGERGHMGFHGYNVYDEQVHVPLVVRSPMASRGARLKSPVELTDIFSTVLYLGGIRNPGISLESRILPVADTPDTMIRPVYSGTRLRLDKLFLTCIADGEDIAMKRNIGTGDMPLQSQWGPTEMVMQQGMKLIVTDHRPTELYSLKTDSAEKVNLYDKGRKIQTQLETLYHRQF